MIFVVEDDKDFSDCLVRYIESEGEEAKTFSDAISVASSLDGTLPSLIFLDILLTGPNGFTLLNELASYSDTSKIPIVIVSSIDFKGKDLSEYGVVGTLNKDSLTPKEVRQYVKRYTH